jgi:predicted ArsR family transcriptional regulator
MLFDVTTEPPLASRVLALLERQGSLGYDEVAAQLGEPPDIVRDALSRLRGLGLVDALTVGELEAHLTRSAAYWRLTEAGRAELARLRAAEPPPGV